MSGATVYLIAYVFGAIPAGLWGLWRASHIPPTHTFDDDDQGDDD